ncbi:MAG TPA: NAD-dependent epimerase/dehydratase family protein [Chitinophagaceae bacterium]|nr:NAD-dependent epimerase/dehydratase family protein [Chitinophagaceae bacterium]
MILVTGGTGLVGSYLLKELVRLNKPVKALYRSAPATLLSAEENAKVQWIQGNVLDVVLLSDILNDVTQIYHCAAVVSFSPSRRKELFKINVEGTANVVNAAVQAGVQKMVHVSSVAAMGRIRNNQVINESMYWTPETSNSSYGHSKYLAELEVWRGIAEGLPSVIVNPTIILGAGNWQQGSSKIFKTAYEEFPWYSQGTSGFVDVRDVVKAMILLMEHDVQAERFILSAGNHAYREVFTSIANEFGKKPPHKKVTPFLASLVWRLEWIKSRLAGQEPMLTRETARTAQAKVEFDNGKFLRLFPQFNYIPVRQSIADTCKQLLKRFPPVGSQAI